MKKTLITSACMLSATYAANKVSAFASVDTSSITATRGFYVVGETGGDEVGYTVTSAGDFNKDNHEDVLITTTKGLAYIVFGKSSSQAAVVFDLADTTKTAADFITITSAETNLVGALAGDIDGDGASDIIIGAPGAGTGAGQAYVIYGTTTPADIPDITTLLTGTKGFSFTNPPAGGAFGSAATAVGDINNDGKEDFAISAPASATDDGKVFVILGTSAKRNADVDLNDLATASTPNGFVIIGEVGAAGELGSSLAGIGDVNGDTFDDILIGAPGDSAAYIVYGMGTIDDVDFSGATTYAKISGAEGSVALAGDFNAGGKDDLIIANPDDGNGKVHIIFGEKLTIDTTTKDVADIDVAEFAAKIIDLGAGTEPSDTNPQQMLEATRQEISILRQVLGHANIIDLQDVFESDAFFFLVFELCPKGELFDHLTSVVTLSEKKTRTIMRQIFEGVAYIHDKNIVHRDLKPENILLDENHNVKITDFGFARQLSENEKLTDLCGTPGYLAPETLKCNMFEGSPGYSKEVDIWACGVIMFTLLVGCPPFWHRKQMVMLRNIMEGKYSFTSPEWIDISEDPKDLIRKCLVVDPSKRITVHEALKHPFFNQMLFEQNIDGIKRSLSTKSRRMSRITEIALLRKQSRFNARKKFQFAILCVRAVIRIKRLRFTAEPLRVEEAVQDPYRVKVLRKVIDGCAFRVYGHWVKKGEGQNRAALFENTPKTELHALYLNNLSR